MASLLPSQNIRRTYVGPNGMIIRQEDPERDITSTPQMRWQKAAALRRRLKQEELRDDDNESDAEGTGEDAEARLASRVVARLQQRVQNSTHGTSSTRSVSACRLAENLMAAKLTAERLNGPLLVDALDEQMQCEVLSALPIEDVGSAAQTCKAWAELIKLVD